MENIQLEGTRFVDKKGRQVLFHGVNVLARSRENNHFYPHLEQVFPYFRRMGYNLLRLGIFWDGAEPQPGQVDREYLEKVKSLVDQASAYGLYVILDMHQDLFAQKFIDGAPDWACLDEGLPHPENCTMWYMAYLSSEAIIRAADNFWANKPAADGVGLLDHYSNMWSEIAQVFDACPNVLGFEPMNEPFMGSVARESFGAASMAMAQKNPNFSLAHPEDISPQEQAEFMGMIAQRFVEFDRTTLMDFYRRIEKAIRCHSQKPLITGGNIFCSTDLPTGIQRLNGPQIFAPHGYDSVVDSDRYDSFSKENVEHLYQGKRQDQNRLGLPVIVGEWGAFPSKPFTNDLIRHMNGILEKNLWGDTYCEYRPGMEQDNNFSSLCRAYPQRTAGILECYHYDEAARRFTMAFTAQAKGETVIFCPFGKGSLTCDVPCTSEVEQLEDGAALWKIEISQPGSVSLTLEEER